MKDLLLYIGVGMFLFFGCASINGNILLTGSLAIVGLILMWISSQLFEYEDITKDTIDFGE